MSGIQIGAVSFLHRFGSSLNAHFHYHVVVLDGVFSESEEGGAEFHEASELEARHWQELQRTVQKRVLRYFRRHDLLDESTTTDMLTWQGTGGFSIDASVRIEGHDRHGLERLVRYCARPPFARAPTRSVGPPPRHRGQRRVALAGHPPQVGRPARLPASRSDTRRSERPRPVAP